MAKVRKKRKHYTAAQRTQILATAQRDKLTANQVRAKFGVTPVTYYSWRKKTGTARRRGRPGVTRMIAGSGDISTQVRSQVRSKIQGMIADVVRSEVDSYLAGMFGEVRRRRMRT